MSYTNTIGLYGNILDEYFALHYKQTVSLNRLGIPIYVRALRWTGLDGTEKRIENLLLSENDVALATDLYELTIAATAYFKSNQTNRIGVFEAFVRKLLGTGHTWLLLLV